MDDDFPLDMVPAEVRRGGIAPFLTPRELARLMRAGRLYYAQFRHEAGLWRTVVTQAAPADNAAPDQYARQHPIPPQLADAVSFQVQAHSNWSAAAIQLKSRERMQPAEYQTLLRMLAANPNYLMLKISTPFTAAEFAEIAAAMTASLAQHDTRVQGLSRRDCKYSLLLNGRVDAPSLLPFVPIVRVLLLNCEPFTGATGELVAALRASPLLNWLQIRGSDTLMAFAADVLRDNRAVGRFGLVPFLDPMPPAFVQLMRQPWIHVNWLNLDSSAITDTAPVVEILRGMPRLQGLSLMNNAITDVDALLWRASIHTALETLLLQGNRIARLDLAPLIAMTMPNSHGHIQLVDFTANPIAALAGTATAEQLRVAMRRRLVHHVRFLGLDAVGV
jgi:hypothetical protein